MASWVLSVTAADGATRIDVETVHEPAHGRARIRYRRLNAAGDEISLHDWEVFDVAAPLGVGGQPVGAAIVAFSTFAALFPGGPSQEQAAGHLRSLGLIEAGAWQA